MGTLGSLLGSDAADEADEKLLLYGLLLMCAADGDIQAEELVLFRAFVQTLPDFRGRDVDQLLRKAQSRLKGMTNLEVAVAPLTEIRKPAIRTKLYVLATDLACASGSVEDTEEQLLVQMQRVLGIDDATARKIQEVMVMKYAR